MAPPAALENRLTDLLLAALAPIGTPAANWRAGVPTITEGIPGDAVPPATGPHLYVQFLRTEALIDGNVGSTVHRATSYFTIWIAGKTQRIMLDAKADVLQAIFAAEGAITASLGQPAWLETFSFRDDMLVAGLFMGGQSLFMTYEVPHAAP